MNSIAFALVLGAIIGVFSAIVVYSYDWRRTMSELYRLKRYNDRLIKQLRDERAAHALDVYWYEKGLSHEPD